MTERTLTLTRLTFALSGALGLGGCGADGTSDGEASDIVETDLAVVGGSAATDCEWPSTVLVESAGLCTGTLIHPKVVTTAAHCITRGSATITFGTSDGPGSFSLDARCVAGADGENGANTKNDWAYCILPDDPRVADVPVTPPLADCEQELLSTGMSAWVVGFGATWSQGPAAGKRQVEVTINAFDKIAPGTIDVGDRSVGACHGDSGGPLYAKLSRDGKDYGVRVLGSTSGPGSAWFCDCSCSTTYIAIANHVRAIERNEGIDVTPCSNADGDWEPTAACDDFAIAPEKGTGTFPNCRFSKTAIPIASCGAAFGAPTSDAGTDAGMTSDAGEGFDAGGGPNNGAGAADAASSHDAALPLDPGNVGVDASTSPPPVTGFASPDAGSNGSPGLVDAGPTQSGTMQDAGFGTNTTTTTNAALPTYSQDGGGCSARSGHARGDSAWLLLLALAAYRRRRFA